MMESMKKQTHQLRHLRKRNAFFLCAQIRCVCLVRTCRALSRGWCRVAGGALGPETKAVVLSWLCHRPVVTFKQNTEYPPCQELGWAGAYLTQVSPPYPQGRPFPRVSTKMVSMELLPELLGAPLTQPTKEGCVPLAPDQPLPHTWPQIFR